MRPLALAVLALRARRRRVYALLGFAAVFLITGVTARILGIGEHGAVEFNQLFRVGGFALPSAVLVMGWLLGRFPLIAILVLMAGIVSDDRVQGYVRLYSVRPASLLRLYAARVALFGAVAFVISAALMPTFDLLMLGEWAGPGTLVLILAYLFAYGGLLVLLSTWTRGDAAITLIVAVLSLVWDSLRRADLLAGTPPGVRELLSFVLPPQGALLELEGAFAQIQPIPWTAFVFVAGYGVVMLVLAGLTISLRER